jgi:hypothetical protein
MLFLKLEERQAESCPVSLTLTFVKKYAEFDSVKLQSKFIAFIVVRT